MGFFNRKKKATPSPAVAFSPVMPEALPIPTVLAPQPPVISYLKLQVVVDRAYGSTASPTFYIYADPNAPASSIKNLVEAHLGGNVSAGCYKVSLRVQVPCLPSGFYPHRRTGSSSYIHGALRHYCRLDFRLPLIQLARP